MTIPFIMGMVVLWSLQGGSCWADSQDVSNARLYESVANSHPRIFITRENIASLRNKATNELSAAYALLTGKMKHSKIPKKLEDIRDYIYKYGYLYQMTGETQWAAYAILAMKQIPDSINAYGAKNKNAALAMEGLAIGYDWCYDQFKLPEERRLFISLINRYYQKNAENQRRLNDFHNYAAQAQFASLIAGLATLNDNPKARDFIRAARDTVEFGEVRDSRLHKAVDSVNYVDGFCNWEGPTYARKPISSYIKYVEAIRTATAGKINLWTGAFAKLENAGYYILYMLRPDNLYANVGDVNYRDISYYDINNMCGLQAVFHNPHFTAFINRHYQRGALGFESEVWLGRYVAPMIFYLLWFDPDVKEADLNELPLSKQFGNAIVIRTGFDASDTFVTFTSGIHWGFHAQLDHGSFTVYKNGPLIIDSGFYDSWGAGKQHNWNYWKRTVAHNGLIIYNPEDHLITYPKKLMLTNDGGQRIAFRSFTPPHMASGYTNKPFSISDLKKRMEEFKMGAIDRYAGTSTYVYIDADLTHAYDNQFSGKGTNQARRVKAVNRQFFYLADDTIVIYDQIDALKAKYKKRWLLHTGSYHDKSGMPVMDGRVKTIEGDGRAGILESVDTQSIKVKNTSTQLSIFPLLPDERVTRRIGGAGYEFWVNGKNYPISKRGIRKGREKEDPGSWRIELEPITNHISESFLNILLFGTAGKNDRPHISKVESEDREMIGAQIGQNNSVIVLFNTNKAANEDRIGYSFESSKLTRHLVTGVKPSSDFLLDYVEDDQVGIVKLSTTEQSSGLRSSADGILEFETPY